MMRFLVVLGMAAAYCRGQGESDVRDHLNAYCIARRTCRTGMTVPEGHVKVKSVASPPGTRLPKSKFGANNEILTIWCALDYARTYGPATPTSLIVTHRE